MSVRRFFPVAKCIAGHPDALATAHHQGCHAPSLSSGDGTARRAPPRDLNKIEVDELPRPLPFVNATDEYGIRFTVDGTLFGLQFPADESGVRLWTLPDGSTSWVPIATAGLAPYAQIIENTPDGGYVAYSGGRDKFTFYRSTDLRTWTTVTVR